MFIFCNNFSFIKYRLRSPKSPDDQCDMGKHSFSYAIMPHRSKKIVIFLFLINLFYYIIFIIICDIYFSCKHFKYIEYVNLVSFKVCNFVQRTMS